MRPATGAGALQRQHRTRGIAFDPGALALCPRAAQGGFGGCRARADRIQVGARDQAVGRQR